MLLLLKKSYKSRDCKFIVSSYFSTLIKDTEDRDNNNSLFQIPIGYELSTKQEEILYNFTKDGGVLALTGAGISTESKIPDYRSPDGSYSKGHKPILHTEFMDDVYKRKRYWARSIVGFKWFDSAEPNIGHRALRYLEQKNIISDIITQNVDSLHFKAGSKSALELHGSNRDVSCTNCGYTEPRPNYQDRINDLNLEWIKNYIPHVVNKDKIRADGDAHLGNVAFDDFQIPGCQRCIEGIMKPNVVFFGGNMQSDVRRNSLKKVEAADKLLICGTSVFVFSAYRLCLKANEMGKEIGIVNIGETRADKFSSFKFESQCGSVLARLSNNF